MKTNPLPVCLVLALASSLMSLAETPKELRPAEKLIKQGNHREALDALKTIMLAPESQAAVVADAFPFAATAAQHLNVQDERAQLIEDTVKAHASQWHVLSAAAQAVEELPHYGHMNGDKFSRDRGEGRWVNCTNRDRIRALQLLADARTKMPADTRIEDKEELLRRLIAAWLNYRPAWKLQILTDLSQLPDFDDAQQESQGSVGHPVDAESRPVFFALPAGYDKAANDGERVRALMQEFAALSDTHAFTARISLALLAQRWLSVSTLADVLHNDEVDPAKQRSSIMAVHTLAEDETTARTAVGPMRFKLPADYAFVAILREALPPNLYVAPRVVGDMYSHGDVRLAARSALIDELRNRRQFAQAAEVLAAELKVEKSKDLRKGLQHDLDQITGNWGRFDAMPAQPAGKPGKLALIFRNATQASLTARRVDVAKLLEDTKDYIKSKPNDEDYRRSQLQAIGQRLMDSRGDRYIGKTVAKWSIDLQPAEKHWDKRMEIETSLTEAGAYLIEAAFNGEHPTRALLWLNGLTLVKTQLSDAWHYFVCDAVTGAPVPDATVEFFAYSREWKDTGGGRNRGTWQYAFDEFSKRTDATGSVQAGKFSGKQMLVSARDAAGRIAFEGFQWTYWNRSHDEQAERTKVYIITDRPVYRPGQEVKWKAWARVASYDSKLDPNPFAGKPVQYGIADPKGEEAMKQNGNADEWGAIEGVYRLPDDAALGVYHVGAKFNDDDSTVGALAFRVEEYKKPEFEVKIDAPDKPIALGDKFEITVKADYYFGGAVKEGRVKYKVMRSPHTDMWFPPGPWDWLFGSGYGWRSLSYGWYPRAETWCICMPRWPWYQWQRDPPELIAEGETAISADGTMKVKIDTALTKELHGDQDHRYEITAEVTDQSRRTIFGKGQVLAARRAFQTYVHLNRGSYFTGDKATAHIYARTLDGRAVKANGTLRVFGVRYDQAGTPQETLVHSAALKLAADDASDPTEFIFPAPGQYRVEATLTDEAQHTIAASEFTLVRGDALNTKDLRFDDLELSLNQDEYQPGDEAELLINTNRPGATVAIFVRGTDKEPQWLHLDAKSTTLRFKLTEADQPNIFVDAYTVSDAKLHKQTRQLILPPRKRIASVELLTDKPDYQPRDQAKATLRVKDQDGKPFIGRVVLTGYDKALEYISGGSNVPEMRSFFWGWKRTHLPSITDTLRSAELYLTKDNEAVMETLGDLDRAYPATAGMGGGARYYNSGGVVTRSRVMAKAAMSPASAAAPPPAAEADAFASNTLSADKDGGGEGHGQNAPMMIRSNLADSAVWLASLKTNDAGEATIDFPMPDNLTAWKLRSWVMGPLTQVGEATVEVRTRKELMVRLQAPRFFVEKDEVVISANVHNETDRDLSVQAVLEASSDGLVMSDTLKREHQTDPTITKAHGEQRFDWRMKVQHSGDVTITVKALADGLSDAMQMTFPIHEHGTLKTDALSIAIRGDQSSGVMKFTVPAERKPETASLEVRYSPTLAMAMIDALPYLADYPYGCTEQTLNRFLPTVITLGVLRDMGIKLDDVRAKVTNLNAQEIGDPKKRSARWQQKDREGKLRTAVFDEDEVKRMARAGLRKLEAMRDDDGGWGWFPGGRGSSAHITALVVHGLHVAAQTKVITRDSIEDMKTATEWLRRHEQHELTRLHLPESHRDHKSWPDDTDALVNFVLTEADEASADMRGELYKQREHLSHYSVALLGLACDMAKEGEQRDMCLRNLRQFLKQDEENQTAWLDLPNEGWWYWWNDSIETQAAFLKLLCAVEPKGELAARVAKYLLNNRRHGTYWNSTRDTAAVIEALALFAKASGESKPELDIEVLIDGKSVKQVHVSGENLFSFDNTFLLEGDAVTTGQHTVELRKKGGAPLYANGYLTLFSKEDPIPAAGLEVKVQRKFYKITEQKTKANVAGSSGQVVQQTGLKDIRTELTSGTPLTSGDTIEVELHIDSKNDYEYVLIADPKPAGFEAIEVRSGWNYDELPSYQEYRDDKVAFFAERLPRGQHTVRYRVKAEIPGKFSALPTKAEAMYAPELRGNAAEWKAVIGDRSM